MAESDAKPAGFFGRVAQAVDGAFGSTFFRIGLFVGTRPCTSIAVTLVFCIACLSGLSQTKSESRGDKLWIPQDTQAQNDQVTYESHFPPSARVEWANLVAKGSSSAVDKNFLIAAMELHTKIEQVTYEGKNLSEVCVKRAGEGHPCFIQSALGLWDYDLQTLRNDQNPLATLNGWGKSEDDLKRMFGDASFSNGELTSAKALQIMYFIQNNRQLDGGGYVDKVAEGWEEKYLELFKCDDPKCDGSTCICGLESTEFTAYPLTIRSFSDAIGTVIRGDVGLINAAFFIMIIYLVLNLGGLCHKLKSRCLLAVACTASIVLAGGSGYGLSSWLQFDYTPVHSVLPFVILGIGVDDSFVIMNSFDRTDPKLPVSERLARALSHSGASILVTSITDFVAFSISVSSSLPALSSFCMYAAFTILILFLVQVTFFSALAVFDARRVASTRIDCCFCFGRCCCCSPAVPIEEAQETVERGEPDPNQLCCTPSRHPGGSIGNFLENVYTPNLLRVPAMAAVVVAFFGFFGLCIFMATKLDVEDVERKFVPDDSYVLQSLEINDRYFGTLGQKVDVTMVGGDYFSAQAALKNVRMRLNALDYLQPATGDAFESWAEAYYNACAVGQSRVGPGVTLDSNGYVTTASAYYTSLQFWLSRDGSRYQSDVVWVDDQDPTKGVAASRISTEYKPFNTIEDDKLEIDTDRAVEVMDKLRDAIDSWTDLPGSRFPYAADFLLWEVFRIIKEELYLNVGLCLLAVFLITLVTIAHPLTSFLVWLSVVMTIVDILGCMYLWGLAIDNVTVIQLVVSVGLCVDYAAHVGHCFMTKSGSRADRVIATLGDVGSAVLNGGCSTFLATMLLALSKSYVFRVLFQTFFLTVVLGLAHGMILLPVLLAIVGPEGYGNRLKPIASAKSASDPSPVTLGDKTCT